MKRPKLVRDKIPEIVEADNCVPVTHIADDAEYWEELKNKLHEEVGEFCEDSCEEELADILEVIYAISEYKKFDRHVVKEIRKKKKALRGAFKERIILETLLSIQA